jgi:hypothetical protein
MLHIYNAKSAKKAARSLEKFASTLGFPLKHGQALDALATMSGFQSWASLNDSLSVEALDAQLMQVELDHIEDNQDVRYGPEYAVVAHNGFELRYAQEGDLLDYVRVCDPQGRETAYWVSDEWQQDPQVVMGAILGALVRGSPVEVGAPAQPRRSEPARTMHAAPTILDLYPFADVSHVVVGGRYARLEYVDQDVARLLKEPAGDSDVEDDAHHGVLGLHVPDRDQVSQVTLATLRGLRWSEEFEAFVSKDGVVYEFYVARKFGDSVQPRPASGAQKPPVAAAAGEQVIELYQLTWKDANGSSTTAEAGRVAGASPEAALRSFRAHPEVFQRATSGPWAADVSLVAQRVDKDNFGPYTVYVDGGFYAECDTVTHAVASMELLAGACTDDVEVRDRHGVPVAYEKLQDEN